MDRVWKIALKRIDEAAISTAARDVIAAYQGVEMETEREADDCFSLFFTVPLSDDDGGGRVELELSVYDLGGGGVVLSLEPDAAENNFYWDEASQLAEDLADSLEGHPVDL